VTLQVIVEGHGDVPSVPRLLRRLQGEAGAFQLAIGRPHRRRRTELVQEQSFRRALRHAASEAGSVAVLVLFDGDDDCPAQLGPQVEEWAEAELPHLKTRVVMAWREFEAWFLASGAKLSLAQ
jgi:hypothetical protein